MQRAPVMTPNLGGRGGEQSWFSTTSLSGRSTPQNSSWFGSSPQSRMATPAAFAAARKSTGPLEHTGGCFPVCVACCVGFVSAVWVQLSR